MKKRMFSPNLFREFMRQLRLPGYIFTVILCIEAILITISGVISSTQYEEFKTISCEFLTMHPLSVLCIYVIAPIMVLCALNWVNKRNSSDFYHSLCETRECVFISAFAAAAAWIAIAFVSSTFISVISHMIFPSIFIVNYTSVLVSSFVILSGSLFIASCIAIAMSITGTTFNNIIISGILIFLPQSIIFAVRTAVIGNLSFMARDGIFGHSYNAPFAMIESLFTGLGFSVFESIAAAVYTLIIAIVYFVIAVRLFKIRKSEFAGNSAVGKKMQAFFRVLVGTVFSLIPCALIYSIINAKIKYNSAPQTDEIFILFVLYIIMIVAICVYELITTKKLRNLISAAKSLIPITLVNVVLLGAMFGVYYWAISFKPDADDIKSVQLDSTSISYYSDDNYFDAMIDDIKLDSPEIKELVSSSLKKNINAEINYSQSFFSGDGTEYTVTINTWSGSHKRRIYLTSDENESLINQLNSNKDYQNVFLKLPKVNSTSIASFYNGGFELNDNQREKLYSLVRQDFANMDFRESFDKVNNMTYKNDPVCNIEITIPVKTKNYRFAISIDEQTPLAYNYFMEISCEHNKANISKVADILNEFVPSDEYKETEQTRFVDVCFYNVKDNAGIAFAQPVYDQDIDFKKLAEFVRKNGSKAPTAGQPMISVYCEEVKDWNVYKDDSFACYMYIPLDSDTLPDFYQSNGNTDDKEKSINEDVTSATDTME